MSVSGARSELKAMVVVEVHARDLLRDGLIRGRASDRLQSQQVTESVILEGLLLQLRCPPPAPAVRLLSLGFGTEDVFTPERFTDEQRMFAKTAEDFMNQEVLLIVDRLERQEEGLMRAVLEKSGELGFLMIDVPEEYGGLDLDKTTPMLVSERLATYASFSVSQGGHIGIGMLPLVFFGTEEQKQRYLPRLASGESRSLHTRSRSRGAAWTPRGASSTRS